MAALLVLVPFFIAGVFPTVAWAYYASLLMTLFALVALGIFLGYISKENLLVSGVKTVTAGVVSIVFSYFLE